MYPDLSSSLLLNVEVVLLIINTIRMKNIEYLVLNTGENKLVLWYIIQITLQKTTDL